MLLIFILAEVLFAVNKSVAQKRCVDEAHSIVFNEMGISEKATFEHTVDSPHNLKKGVQEKDRIKTWSGQWQTVLPMGV